ncbi:MAG: magnesium transporter [Desulfovibrio sp.]|jgi:magnesium transporter|nr:magnesium transporter [Desulfovibrio sp.]
MSNPPASSLPPPPADRPLPEEAPPPSPDLESRAEAQGITAIADLGHPADLAEHIENLSLKDQMDLLCALPEEDAAGALAEMEEYSRVEILEKLDPDKAAGILGEMSPDDAADVLDELGTAHSDAILDKLGSEDAEEIRQLMAFDPDTAGGAMNTEIVVLEADLTADQAISQLRREIEDKEIPYYAYIVNPGNVLIGVLSLRDLLLLPSRATLGDAVGDQVLITVRGEQGKEEVARLIARYNFMALPVVDGSGRLLGVISHDDVIDIINDLASEDLLGMVGAGQDENVDTPWLESVRMRLPWLLVNTFNSALAAGIVYLFDGSIAQMAFLAVLMPMVANQAGNTGQQALAVIIRQLARERFDPRRAWQYVFREGKIGLLNGLLLGVLAWSGVLLLTSNPSLASVMAGALILDMLLGAMAGASIPLLLKALGRDPAQASSIFLTALTDGAGFFLFLGLATLFLL